jgi:hypothetical protein
MDFSQLMTLADWTSALEQLIASSNTALQNNDDTQISDLQDVLFQFQRQSPPNFESLDTIAFKTSLELNRANRNTALKNLANLSQELKNLNSILGVATENATQSADALQLKNVKDFLSKAKTSLTILKGLRNDLADNSTDLGKKITAVFKAIKDFEEAFPDA